MRRKRRTKYHWLFNTGTTGPGAAPNDFINGRDFGTVTPGTNGSTAMVIFDLLNDNPSDDETTRLLPMGVYTNNDYFIKRIVGKIFLSTLTSASTAPALLVGFGIFVARAGDEDAGAGASFRPIGVSAAATTFGTDPQAVLNYSPLSLECIREPWIWRRTWILGNPANVGGDIASAAFPRTNTLYGSIQDGAHIDAKTARRVKDGERLFGVLAARNFPVNTTTDDQNLVRGYLDYRVLGAPRRSRNRSAF